MIPLIERNGKFINPEISMPSCGEYDIVVCGGGMAGIGAALSAARAGCKTLLLERESMLGGLATAGLVNIPLDFAKGISAEMLRRLDAVNGHWHRNSDPEKHKLILDRMTAEAGVEVLFVSHAVDAMVENGRIRGVVIENKSGRQVVLAGRVIDCTGDADIAFFAGCECMAGRPSDGKHQACSLEFRLGGVDWDRYQESELKRTDPSWINLIGKAVADGDMPYPIDNHLNWVTHVPGRPQHCGKDEISMCFAHSRNCRPLDARDLTRMYVEGREQADILSKFIKKCVPGFEDSYLIDTGSLLGVRESRRVVGEYVLTTLDFARATPFDDTVCMTGHHYDLHNPDGPGNVKWAEIEIDGKIHYVSTHGKGGSWAPPGGYEAISDGWGRTGADFRRKELPSSIPYRSLVPLGIDNLLVAGRCLSSEFMAQAGCRLILTCCNMGQAAGTAAALSLKAGVTPRKVDTKELRQRLIADGCEVGQSFLKQRMLLEPA
ncbi:Glucose inhibited division protein A [Opitutaceae bacterium TAV1]|nr:Glucose inhibited division protein A [Opitutaceae bacterium TAV1]